MLRAVDTAMAEARCQLTLSRLEWLDEAAEADCDLALRSAKEEIIQGQLKNNKGMIDILDNI